MVSKGTFDTYLIIFIYKKDAIMYISHVFTPDTTYKYKVNIIDTNISRYHNGYIYKYLL